MAVLVPNSDISGVPNMGVMLRIGTELGRGGGGPNYKKLVSYNWDPTVPCYIFFKIYIYFEVQLYELTKFSSLCKQLHTGICKI